MRLHDRYAFIVIVRSYNLVRCKYMCNVLRFMGSVCVCSIEFVRSYDIVLIPNTNTTNDRAYPIMVYRYIISDSSVWDRIW
jgi:hypothetical protein